MSACEKCWRDAGGDPDRYHELLNQRKDSPCTPEEQAGGKDAEFCYHCHRRTIHLYTKKCTNSNCIQFSKRT